MTETIRPGLLDVIAAFFGTEREVGPAQVYLGPCDRAEPASPQAADYVTEIWCPPADDGIQRLHSPMPEPEPELEIS